MYVCMCVYMNVRIYVSMYVCMYICMYVCIYVCMYVCMFALNSERLTLNFFSLILCKTDAFYFLVGSLSIIIYSYNENCVLVMCRDMYNLVHIKRTGHLAALRTHDVVQLVVVKTAEILVWIFML